MEKNDKNKLLVFEILVDRVDDNVYGFVDAEEAAVKAEVIVRLIAPSALGVVIIVVCAVLIGFDDFGLDLVGRDAVLFYRALALVFLVGVDENIDNVLAVFENIVGATPDDNARAFVGDMTDNIASRDKEFVGKRQLRSGNVRTRAITAEREIVQEFILDFLLGILDKTDCKPALLRGHFDNLAVVERDTEFFRDFSADDFAAATVFAADSNDNFLVHNISPLAQAIRSSPGNFQ